MALAVTLAESDSDVIVMDREESSIPERMIGKTVEQIQLRRKYGLNIIAVIGKVDNINTFEKSL